MNKAKKILNKLYLRPTLQRIAIIDILLKKGNVHVTANSLKQMLNKAKKNIATATIYNNLNELSEKGFLKKVLVEKDKMWFDTNLENHYHLYDEEEDSLTDVMSDNINLSTLPKIPKGKKLKSIDIIIKIEKK